MVWVTPSLRGVEEITPAIWNQDVVENSIYLHNLLGGHNAVGGRLTAVSGTPLGDVEGASTLFFTPYIHDRVPTWDGNRWIVRQFTQVSMSLHGHDANRNYDVFLVWDGVNFSMTDVVWINDTTRRVSFSRSGGMLVDASNPDRLFLGTFRTRGDVATQTNDSPGFRMVSNYFNRRPRPLSATLANSAGTISQTTAEISNLFRVHYVSCRNDNFLDISWMGSFYDSTSRANNYQMRNNNENIKAVIYLGDQAGAGSNHGAPVHLRYAGMAPLGWEYIKIYGSASTSNSFKWQIYGTPTGTVGYIWG